MQTAISGINDIDVRKSIVDNQMVQQANRFDRTMQAQTEQLNLMQKLGKSEAEITVKREELDQVRRLFVQDQSKLLLEK